MYISYYKSQYHIFHAISHCPGFTMLHAPWHWTTRMWSLSFSDLLSTLFSSFYAFLISPLPSLSANHLQKESPLKQAELPSVSGNYHSFPELFLLFLIFTMDPMEMQLMYFIFFIYKVGSQCWPFSSKITVICSTPESRADGSKEPHLLHLVPEQRRWAASWSNGTR